MRLIQLDLIRCLALILVLGRHITPCPPETNTFVWALTFVWHRGGWIGVDMFFVLSGFLVSGLLFREYEDRKVVGVTRFLIRRAFKIYPSFWVMLGATVVVKFIMEGGISRRNLIGEFFFMQNYIGAFWMHTWSLAVEEHFYILLALLTVWLFHRQQSQQKNPFALLPSIFVIVAIACFCLRLLMAVMVPYSHTTHLFATHLRIDSLLFGVLISYYWHFKKLSENTALSRHRLSLFMIGTALLSPAFIFPLKQTRWLPVFGVTLFYIGSGAILLALLYTHIPHSRVMIGLAKIGAFSYSIYLWHLPVLEWGIPMAEKWVGAPLNWFIYAGVYLVGSIVVGIATAKMIEYPALVLRDRLYPSYKLQQSS